MTYMLRPSILALVNPLSMIYLMKHCARVNLAGYIVQFLLMALPLMALSSMITSI